MNKRGQAAMEFLMTYGWAILAAIIAIGVLAYLGIFSPSVSTALVAAPFYANAWNAQATGSVINVEIINNGGESVDVQSFVIDVTSPFTETCTDSEIAAAELPLTPGESTTVAMVTDGAGDECGALGAAITAGQTVRGDITITYQRVGSDVDLTSTGSVTDTVV